MRLSRPLTLLMLASVALAGCLDDASSDDATLDDDVDADAGPLILDSVSGFDAIAATLALPGGGQGIWIHDDILYHTNGGDLHTVDVSDPTDPKELGSLTDIGARDVDVLGWDGAVYAVLAGSSSGMHVVDVTDPAGPTLVGTEEMPNAGVHNVAAVPGTPYIYASGASAERMIDVLDITDPTDPTVHSFAIPDEMGGVALESNGCHDITVRPDLGRAYCAGGGSQYGSGGGESFIWDISTPESLTGNTTTPRWVSMMDDDRLYYHHQAFVNGDGTILIINDEKIENNCMSLQTPLPMVEYTDTEAAAWVWDISDEENPVLRSHVQNPVATEDPTRLMDTNCGSHFGDLVPGHDIFVMGWYQGGTIMVDFSDPDDARIIDQVQGPGSTWDARYHKGHVFHAAGDLVTTPILG